MDYPGNLYVVAAPSGAGKSSLVNALLELDSHLVVSLSHTTRAPRGQEQDGREYHFVDEAEFRAMVARGAFVEWAEVHGNCYGTSRMEIENARSIPGCSGMIFDIDYQGARQIRAKQADCAAVFILPPSMKELERRLRGRASESEEVVIRRFEAARKEIAHYGLFDYLVVNDDLDEAFRHLEGIVLAERSKRQRRADLAERLLRAGKL